ncbi:MAG: DUF1987 domain-containing protein [Bacteroidales bacterium]|nr:DUF1987 domain-containing protein [Bacteroidales bacterium]
MLKPLKIHAKNFLPFVHFDKEQSIFKIEGKSIPEDSAEFYSGVFEWLNLYKEQPNNETILVLKLDYYNSSSAREIANIIKLFDELYQKGHNIKIQWMYNPDDEVMKENGEDFSILFSVPIDIIDYIE